MTSIVLIACAIIILFLAPADKAAAPEPDVEPYVISDSLLRETIRAQRDTIIELRQAAADRRARSIFICDTARLR